MIRNNGKFILTFFICLSCLGVFAAKEQTQNSQPAVSSLSITKIGAKLFVKGQIDTGFCEAVKKEIDASVRTLVITSGGGDVSEGVCLGEYIRDNKLDIEVKDYCGSSCANYLFTAAQNKTILPNSYVGFHGSGLQLKQTPDEYRRFIEKEISLYYFLYFKISGKLEKVLNNALAEYLASYQPEENFFNSINIDQTLFVVSSKIDKGLGDGKPYVFLVPTVEVMAAYGIHNIKGENDFETCIKHVKKCAHGTTKANL